MCQLLETIKVYQNRLELIQYHEDRINRSRKLLFGLNERWNLSEMIKVPVLDPDRVYKCRFLYRTEPEKIEFIPYIRKEVKKLYAIDCDDLDYSFKYSDRRSLDSLRSQIPDPLRADILIIKKGCITDTSFANIVLWDGNMWYTPEFPLLAGTKRQYYIDNGVIVAKPVKWCDLHHYKKACLINSMLDLEESTDIPVECISSVHD